MFGLQVASNHLRSMLCERLALPLQLHDQGAQDWGPWLARKKRRQANLNPQTRNPKPCPETKAMKLPVLVAFLSLAHLARSDENDVTIGTSHGIEFGRR